MIIFVAVIALICLYNLKLPLKKNSTVGYEKGIFNDYMSLEKTTSIKGIFILIVFISHSLSYLTMSSSILDTSGKLIVSQLLGQAMVAPFLFYSGYGVMLSIDKKGKDYIRSIPTKRFLKVLVHFDIAVLLFLILALFTSKELNVAKVLLSFTGWDSVGNSNWYIFDILVLYLITYISFLLGSKNKFVGLAINIVLCGVLVIVLRHTKQVHWYDTIMCYPVGMLFYMVKPKFNEIIKKHNVIYWLLFVVCVGALGVSVKLGGTMMSMIKNVVFALFVVLITMKFSINNTILNFCGKHLFSIYILQRIPMNILSYLGFDNKYLFVIISIVATIPLAIAFDFAMAKLDLLMFKSKKTIKG